MLLLGLLARPSFGAVEILEGASPPEGFRLVAELQEQDAAGRQDLDESCIGAQALPEIRTHREAAPVIPGLRFHSQGLHAPSNKHYPHFRLFVGNVKSLTSRHAPF